MSTARNRSNSQGSLRTLMLDLQGEMDTLMAFDGFEPQSPVVQPLVLQRPPERKALSLLERLIVQVRGWLGAVRRLAKG